MQYLLYFTAFLSAFLLFCLQPLIARAILPWFGGAAGVWNCAQFFFQGVLLLGYGYAHLSITGALSRSREQDRASATQSKLHFGLIGLSLLFLPVLPSHRWKPDSADDPAVLVMLALIFTIGLPYLVLSSTSPLVASWYARFFPGKSPYVLFAWSNLGSLLGLLAYPMLFEPLFGVRVQAWIWSTGYLGCAALLVYFAYKQGRVAFLPREELTVPEDVVEIASKWPSADVLLLWVGLPACSSLLLVAVTHYITTEIAAVPLLWVIPLAIYLASYIFVASSWNLYQRWLFLPLAPFALYGVQRLLDPAGYSPFSIVFLLWACLAVLFIILHGELWKQRPGALYLSHFYMTMSAGGALGSFLVAYVFPKIFNANYELYLTVLFCPLIILWSAFWERARSWKLWQGLCLLAALLVFWYVLGVELLQAAWKYNGSNIASLRNFYGTAWVAQVNGPPTVRVLYNGRINHGCEYMQPDKQLFPTGYFSASSGVGRLFTWLERDRPALRAGIVGLGVGTLAAYARPGDDFTLYELDPKIEALAERYFSFVPKCSGAHRVVLGDARLSLEKVPDHTYDFLVIDAFTGDSIPVHLLTAEAFQTYKRVLKRDGILALHVSNLYLDLPPLVRAQAEKLGYRSLLVTDQPGTDPLCFPSQWTVVYPDAHLELELKKLGFREVEGEQRAWTDDDSNVLRVIKPDAWQRFSQKDGR